MAKEPKDTERKPLECVLGMTCAEAMSLRMLFQIVGVHTHACQRVGLIHQIAGDLVSGKYFAPGPERDQGALSAGEAVEWINDLQGLAAALETWQDRRDVFMAAQGSGPKETRN